MARILFLCQRIPYPPNKGEKIRAYEMVRHLAARHEVHLGSIVDDPIDLPGRDVLRAIVADAHFAVLDRRRARWTCLRGLLTGDALSVAFFRDRGLRRWVDRVLAEIRPEIVLVYSSNMAPYIPDRPRAGARRIVDLVDVDSLKWLALARRGNPAMRLIHAREAHLVRRLERRIAAEADHCVLVSEAEAALFRTAAPNAQATICAIGNGVDAAYFDPALPHANPFEGAAPRLVFTGTMDYPPNVDAVAWFATAILPAVRDRLTDARFVIVGANPSAQVLELARLPGVTVTGRVPDVRPYLAHATAIVAPMRVARGIQNKVLEGMAMARPVVVTPQALEGIDAEPGRQVALAADEAAMVEHIVTVADPAVGCAMGGAARACVLAEFAWAAKLAALDRLVAMP